jgi:hypothetical protein
MNMSNTTEIIKQIQEMESAKLISYILADRLQGPSASIATDALGLFYRHLEALGESPKIILFLYSTGGDTMVPWRLINLVREYCKELITFVPDKAFSAATMLCLGSDEIVMTKMAALSPIDPSVANAFNPPIPMPAGSPPQVAQRVPISVEDVAAYLRLATDRSGLNTVEGKIAAFQELAHVVHPLALGNVERSHTLIRSLAKKLLELHMNITDKTEEEKCKAIVDTLTEKLYSHQHMIPRKEARDIIGLKVRFPSKDLETLMIKLYEQYKKELGIGEMLNPITLLDNRNEIPLELAIAKIETVNTEDKFIMKGKIIRAAQPNQAPAVNIVEQGWVKAR